MSERIQTPDLADVAEDELERTLRPRRLDEFVGQPGLKEQLRVAVEAAGARGEALDHVLLAGPPGLGKTSLAQIIAAELDVAFVSTAAPALERKADVAAILTALEPRAVLFVDEIHRLSRALEETFYPAMEDRQLPITVGQGAGARVVTLDLPAFTLIGATTRAGRLTTPLRDRFGIQHRPAAARRSRAARAGPRASPTACSSACATTRRSAPTGRSPRRSRPPPWTCSRWTTSAWTAWTARSSPPSARSSTAARWGCRRSR